MPGRRRRPSMVGTPGMGVPAYRCGTRPGRSGTILRGPIGPHR
ncbi:hypothetical protein Taro_022853 [Colocasia esculenta]|uniref:Uncharacterized protein n=1 Tax=Colocasia esculenta TaxID=4460 RepID=A0A843V945_COLES|nr:hypothetical protein [Colocasia esculenta]